MLDDGYELVANALGRGEIGAAVQALNQGRVTVQSALRAALDYSQYGIDMEFAILQACLRRGGADLQAAAAHAADIGGVPAMRLLVEAGAPTAGCMVLAARRANKRLMHYLIEGAPPNEMNQALLALAPVLLTERDLPLAQLCNTGDGETLDEFARQAADFGLAHCVRWRLQQEPQIAAETVRIIMQDRRFPKVEPPRHFTIAQSAVASYKDKNAAGS